MNAESDLVEHPEIGTYVFIRQCIPRKLREQEKLNPDGTKELVYVPIASGNSGTLLLFSNDLFGVTVEDKTVRLLPEGDIYEYPKIIAQHHARIAGNASSSLEEAFSGLVVSLSKVCDAIIYSDQS